MTLARPGALGNTDYTYDSSSSGTEDDQVWPPRFKRASVMPDSDLVRKTGFTSVLKSNDAEIEEFTSTVKPCVCDEMIVTTAYMTKSVQLVMTTKPEQVSGLLPDRPSLNMRQEATTKSTIPMIASDSGQLDPKTESFLSPDYLATTEDRDSVRKALLSVALKREIRGDDALDTPENDHEFIDHFEQKLNQTTITHMTHTYVDQFLG